MLTALGEHVSFLWFEEDMLVQSCKHGTQPFIVGRRLEDFNACSEDGRMITLASRFPSCLSARIR